MLEVLILSIIQGITEFIPISSSSHLILVSHYLNFDDQSLSIDLSLHVGSFLAVITYFRKDIFYFIKNKDLFIEIVVSSIPVMLVGFFLIKFDLIESLRNPEIIGWTTLIFGILLYISDKSTLEKKINNNFTFKTAIFIGISQILSLIPGVSRSGISITAARMLKFKRIDSAKISCLLSIPTLAAVTIFGFKNLILSENFNITILNVLSILLSYFFSYITIKFFLNYIHKFSLTLFVIYRIMLGIFLLFFTYL